MHRKRPWTIYDVRENPGNIIKRYSKNFPFRVYCLALRDYNDINVKQE